MTVGELKRILEAVGDDVVVRGADKTEFCSVSLFMGDEDEVWLEAE